MILLTQISNISKFRTTTRTLNLGGSILTSETYLKMNPKLNK